MNTGVWVSLWDACFISFESIPRSGIAGSHASSTCKSLRELPPVFHNGSTNLYFCKQCTGVPSPQPCQNMLSCACRWLAIRLAVMGNLIVVLICMSLTILGNIGTFSYIHWPFVYLLLRNVGGGPLLNLIGMFFVLLLSWWVPSFPICRHTTFFSCHIALAAASTTVLGRGALLLTLVERSMFLPLRWH